LFQSLIENLETQGGGKNGLTQKLNIELGGGLGDSGTGLEYMAMFFKQDNDRDIFDFYRNEMWSKGMGDFMGQHRNGDGENVGGAPIMEMKSTGRGGRVHPEP
jgi:hypothetical protein